MFVSVSVKGRFKGEVHTSVTEMTIRLGLGLGLGVGSRVRSIPR